MQTQVTGINDPGVTVGFWSGQNTESLSNDNFGFYASGASSTASPSPPETTPARRSTSSSA